MTTNKKKPKTAADVVKFVSAHGPDAFLQQSFLMGGEEWTLPDVLVSLHNCHEVATCEFFQQHANLDKLTDVYGYLSIESDVDIRGMPGKTIANTLMTIPAFRRTPMALDYAFLNRSFDGYNTPGIFGLCMCDDQWLADMKMKHQKNFAQILSDLYVQDEVYSGKFKTCKKLSEFINSISDLFEPLTSDGIELLAGPAVHSASEELDPVQFVQYQFEVVSTCYIAQQLDAELKSSAAFPPEVQHDLLFESIEAILAFNPARAHEIRKQIIKCSNELRLPPEIYEFVLRQSNHMELANIGFNPVDDLLEVEPNTTPAFY